MTMVLVFHPDRGPVPHFFQWHWAAQVFAFFVNMTGLYATVDRGPE